MVIKPAHACDGSSSSEMRLGIRIHVCQTSWISAQAAKKHCLAMKQGEQMRHRSSKKIIVGFQHIKIIGFSCAMCLASKKSQNQDNAMNEREHIQDDIDDRITSFHLFAIMLYP